MNFFIRYVQMPTTTMMAMMPTVPTSLSIPAAAYAGASESNGTTKTAERKMRSFFKEQPPFYKLKTHKKTNLSKYHLISAVRVDL